MASNNKLVRTLDDLVSYGENSDFSDKKMIYLRKEDNVIFADDLVYDKYRNMLFEYRILRTLTTEEQQKYKYKPDKFAMDNYGNPNLANLMLYINGCSETEFATNSTVYYLDQEAIETILTNILVHETERISDASKKAYE